jgi:hypothetical protein
MYYIIAHDVYKGSFSQAQFLGIEYTSCNP